MPDAPAPAPSHSARQVRRGLQQLAGLGVDVERLCRDVGLRREALEDPEARVPLAVLDELLERAVGLTYDDQLGLHMAGLGVVDPDDLASAAIATAATVGESLARGVRYQRLWSDGVRIHFEETEEGVRMGFARQGPYRAAHRHFVELALLQLVVGVRALTGAEVRPLRVRFSHPAPADTREHQRLFGCPLLFGAPASDVELSREDAARPLLHADALAHAVFSHQTEKALARLPDATPSTADRVREVVRRLLPGGDVSFAAVARALHAAPRTLQRRLAAEGHTYAVLLEEERRQLAAGYLGRSLSIAEVSFLLGYSEPSVFHRAFKRWWGMSPEAFRRARACGGA